jgi:ribose transport system permease protein
MKQGDITARLRSLLYVQSFWVLVIIVALVVLFGIISPAGTFLTAFNFQSLLSDSAELVILTVGVTFVLIAAGIDLSLGAILVLSTVVTLKLMLVLTGSVSAIVLIVVGTGFSVVFASVCGWINGILIARLHIPSFIATLATAGTALGVARLVSGGTNVSGVPPELMTVMNFRFLGLQLPVYVAALVAIVGVIVLNSTAFGLYTLAIGSNTESARRAGINVNRQIIAVYALMGAIAGLVAMVDLGRFGVASINAHTTDSLQAIAGAVIGGASLFGGRGTILGAVLGAFIPALLRNGFIILGFEAYWQEIAIGLVLVAAVYFDQWRRTQMVRLQAWNALHEDHLVGPETKKPVRNAEAIP